jgi:hypothetical protein
MFHKIYFKECFMKNTMRKGFLFLALALFVAGGVFAQQASEGDFRYDWDKNVKDGIEITKYTGKDKEVSIPSTIKNYKVTSIGNGAFSSNRTVTSVIIPSNVITIGVAFQSCTSLASVTIPNTVTSIGRAFQKCTSLASVTIPNSVTTIGERAFEDCTGLEKITIPNSVTTIGNRAFENCTSLASVTIGNGVTTIGDFAFNNCTSLASVTIGTGVTTIGRNAFSSCTGLPSVTIPKNVTIICVEAFKNCKDLNSVTFQGSIAAKDLGFIGAISKATNIVDLFPGDLPNKYLDNVDGGPGTYIRFANGKEWRKR